MLARPDQNHRPLYSPEMWNVLDRFNMQAPTTNNNVEAWHTRLKATIARQHPSVYLLLHKLRLEQARTERQVVNLRAGARPPGRRRIHKQRLARISHLVQTRVGRMPLDYLRGIAHNFSFQHRLLHLNENH